MGINKASIVEYLSVSALFFVLSSYGHIFHYNQRKPLLEFAMPVSAIFMLFFKLGCTAFGGPIAHLGYFQRTFVEEKQWLSAQEYSELIALCNFLPGPPARKSAWRWATAKEGYSVA